MAMMVDESAAMLGATARAAGLSEAEAGVADTMPKSRAERPMVLEEQAALPKMLEGVVGHAVRPPSPRWCHQRRRKRTRWKRLSVRKHDLKPFESSTNGAMKWWSWKRRTPPGSSGGWSPPFAQ